LDKPAVRFQRANYVVRNLDRALDFYTGVLGLSLDFIKESDAASYSYTVFRIPKDARIRFAVLSAPGQPRVMALTEITGVPLQPVAHPRRAAIVLETPDIDALAERARAKGFAVCPEGVLLTFDGRRGRELGLVDPDDNLAVVYAIPEGS
jgi:catechol 2,3-dioxygenase-like lactoylglutathione lyase family enzyme